MQLETTGITRALYRVHTPCAYCAIYRSTFVYMIRNATDSADSATDSAASQHNPNPKPKSKSSFFVEMLRLCCRDPGDISQKQLVLSLH